MSKINRENNPVIESKRNKLRYAAWIKLPIPYLTFLPGLFVSRLGDSLYSFAVPWISYQLTHSSIVLSSMFAVSVLPVVLFGSIVGVIVDVFDRRKLMLATDAVRAVLVALVPLLEQVGQLHLWHLYVIAFLLAVLSLMFDVANIASVPALAGKELTRANASSQFINQLTDMIGPAIAGVVVAALGGYRALWLDAISFGATWMAVYRLPYLGGGQSSFKLSRIFADMKDGLRWLVKDRLNLALSLQAMVGNFGYSAAFSVLMYYLLSELHLNAHQSSINYSIIGFGGLLGSLLIVPLEKVFKKGVLISVLLTIGAIGFLIPTYNHFWLAPGIAFAIVGICNVGWNTLVQSMRQMTVPPEMLGRVLGFSRVISRLAMPIGAAIAGLLTVNSSPVIIFVIAAVAKLVEVVIAVLSPIRRM
nr:MFS transporter [Gorillibacterium massiliense]